MTVVQDMESSQVLRRPRKGRASHFSQGGWVTERARSMFHCGLASPVPGLNRNPIAIFGNRRNGATENMSYVFPSVPRHIFAMCGWLFCNVLM